MIADNVERRKEVESVKSPDEDDQHGQHSKLSAGSNLFLLISKNFNKRKYKYKHMH